MSEHDTRVAKPQRVGPDEDADPARLAIPGTVVRRWTRSLAEIDPTFDRPVLIVAPMPCHPRQQVTVPREVTGAVAVCRQCSITFNLTTWDEGDGGYAAEFTVAYTPFYLSDARTRT